MASIDQLYSKCEDRRCCRFLYKSYACLAFLRLFDLSASHCNFRSKNEILVLACLVSATSALPFIGSVQSVAVRGALTCNGKPAENVKVKLYEKEVCESFPYTEGLPLLLKMNELMKSLVLDKLLDEKFTDAKGTFEMSGSKKEVTTIDPKVNIYHKCNYNGICYKKISVKIPKNFVTEGETPSKVFDIGELNLAGSFSGESTDCLN
ncbi:Transthyretin-like family protein [Cooperia oncophora]